MVMEIQYGIDREAEGIECKCGGYARRVDVTKDEERLLGCGRPRCCSRAFVCAVCKARIVGKAEAPEMR
jgi:hypothetical protein